MAEPIVIKSLEQLKPFLNNDNVIEIVTRGKKKKFKKFFNLMLDNDAINDLTNNTQLLKNQQGLMQNVLGAVGKNTSMAQKSVDVMEKVSKLQVAGLVLNVLNLGATCVGFRIMDKKLNKMRAQFDEKMKQLERIITTENTIQAEIDFINVRGEHSHMLDCRRIQNPFDVNEMWKLVHKEYIVLNTLIRVFKEDVSSDKQAVFTMIFSLLAMFTATLKYYDEIYYVKNCKALNGKNVLHTSHSEWMHIYEMLSEDWMVEYIQDHAVFDCHLNPRDADVYYREMMSVVIDGKQEIVDNITLLNTLKDVDLISAFHEYTSETAREEMEELLDEVFSKVGCNEFKADFDNILNEAIAIY